MHDENRPAPHPSARQAPACFRKHFTALGRLLLLVSIVSTACWQSPTTGPGEIKWDRQTCERCQMVISERPHAAQVRKVGDKHVHAFDDIGCALLWLDEQDLLDSGQRPEVWVLGPAGAKWIDGTSAHFESGHHTPMQYGWTVADEGSTLEAVREQVREAERARRSKPASSEDGMEGPRG